MAEGTEDSTEKTPAATARERRRAEALRVNLARRKAQARARAAGEPADKGGEGGKKA